MKYCDLSSEDGYKVSLLFLFSGIGAVLPAAQAVWFGFKWAVNTQSDQKKNPLFILAGVTVISTAVVRTLRFIGTLMMYYESRFAVDSLSYGTNVISGLGTQLSLGLCLILKLKKTFEGSVYALSKTELRVLYGMLLCNQLCLYTVLVLLTWSSMNSSFIGQLIILIAAFGALLFGVTFVGAVDIDFSNRLVSIVIASEVASSDRGSASPNSGRLTSMSAESDRIKRSPTISILSLNQQFLLKIAIRSLNNSVWITASLLSAIIGLILEVFGKCSQWPSIFARLFLALSGITLTLAVSFILPLFTEQYEWMCSMSDRWIRQMIAYRTHRDVMEMLQERDEQVVPEMGPLEAIEI